MATKNSPNVSIPTVSIIVPLFNEEDSAPLLHKKIHQALATISIGYEIIFVDDGSTDATARVCQQLCQQDPALVFIQLRRNCGQTPAMAAGIDHARGQLLITMDGDLQNDPSDIPMMIDKINQGYDIVVGWRHKRQDKFLSRKLPSMIANWLIGKITGVPIKDNGCSLKVYRARVMQSVPFYSEMHRFIPALLSLAGVRVAQVKVKHHARQYGESKYGLSRVYKVLFDLLTIKTIQSIASHPVAWFTKLAAPALVAGLLCMIGMLFWWRDGGSIIVLASTGLICLSTAIFTVFLGLLSELIYQRGKVDITQLALLTANPSRNRDHHEK